MSLVLAAHNDIEIVVAFDDLSTSTKSGVSAPDDAIRKVRQVNARLALAVTGTYASDKLPFLASYAAAVADELELDAALDVLFDSAVSTMRVHDGEGFRMSLIGFNGDSPGFKCVDVEKGNGFTALGESRRNYWVSGESEPAEHAIRAIEGGGIIRKPSALDIERELHAIVTDCIERYPRTLGLPVNVLRLYR